MDRLSAPPPDHRARARRGVVAGISLVAAAGLVGCGSSGPEAATDPEPSTTPSVAPDTGPTTETSASAAPQGLEGFDFGNTRWTFRALVEQPETTRVRVTDGRAEQGPFSYVVGEPVLADLTGDGLADAAVQITEENDGIANVQWYLWVADGDGGAEQISLPIARTTRCGTTTVSVRAVRRGIEVHELRRAIGEAESLPCSEPGTDERTRVVRAERAGGNDEWWPVEVAPNRGFGGLCPTAAEYEGYPWDGPLFVGPNRTSTRVEPGQTTVFSLEGWPVYGEDFVGWSLVGVRQGDDFSCAWTPPRG